MKKIVYLWCNVILVVIIVSLTFIGCMQKPTSDLPMKTTYNVDTNEAFQFAFHYEKEEPKLEFISPKGIVYKEGVTSSDKLIIERATQVNGLKSVYFIFSEGEIGEWQIFYDKLSNPSIEFYYTRE